MTFQQPGDYPQSQPPPYPGYPGGYPGGGIDQSVRPPSRGTAITAGVLAALGAAWGAYAGIKRFSGISTVIGDLRWIAWMQAVVFLVELVVLGAGAILIFTRKPAGRWLVAGGSALHIIQGIIVLIGFTSRISDQTSHTAELVGAGTIGLVIVLLPAIATLVLALVPPTGRWLAWGSAPKPQYAQQPPYPPQSQYPQQSQQPQQPPYPPQSGTYPPQS